jgi:hypothetical protein
MQWILFATGCGLIGGLGFAVLFLQMESRFGVAGGWKPPLLHPEGFRHFKDTKVVSKEVLHHAVSWNDPLICNIGEPPGTADVTQQEWPGPAATHRTGWYG